MTLARARKRCGYLAVAVAVLAPRWVQAQVVVDFSARESPASMSGFLHGLRTGVADTMIAPLRPNLWRVGNLDAYDRLTRLGARVQLVVSDLHKGNKRPYLDFSAYEEFVRQLARAHKGKALLWDVWNEPNHKQFFIGTREQAFETYVRAYRVLRAELGPEAMIGGPSLTHFDRSWLAAFLEYCRDQKAEVNFLAWHEMKTADISAIRAHVEDMRAAFVTNPDYAAVRIKEIHINEYNGADAQHAPAAQLAYLFHLEAARVDGACKACWPETGGSSCSNMDGLVTRGRPALPRASWWLYKLYADGVGGRVRSTSSVEGVVALGSVRSALPDHPSVLVGRMPAGPAPRGATALPPAAPPPLTVRLTGFTKVPALAGATSLRVKIEAVPSSGEAPLSRLPVVLEQLAPVQTGAATITIPADTGYQVFFLTVW